MFDLYEYKSHVTAFVVDLESYAEKRKFAFIKKYRSVIDILSV